MSTHQAHRHVTYGSSHPSTKTADTGPAMVKLPTLMSQHSMDSHVSEPHQAAYLPSSPPAKRPRIKPSLNLAPSDSATVLPFCSGPPTGRTAGGSTAGGSTVHARSTAGGSTANARSTADRWPLESSAGQYVPPRSNVVLPASAARRAPSQECDLHDAHDVATAHSPTSSLSYCSQMQMSADEVTHRRHQHVGGAAAAASHRRHQHRFVRIAADHATGGAAPPPASSVAVPLSDGSGNISGATSVSEQQQQLQAALLPLLSTAAMQQQQQQQHSLAFPMRWSPNSLNNLNLSNWGVQEGPVAALPTAWACGPPHSAPAPLPPWMTNAVATAPPAAFSPSGGNCPPVDALPDSVLALMMMALQQRQQQEQQQVAEHEQRQQQPQRISEGHEQWQQQHQRNSTAAPSSQQALQHQPPSQVVEVGFAAETTQTVLDQHKQRHDAAMLTLQQLHHQHQLQHKSVAAAPATSVSSPLVAPLRQDEGVAAMQAAHHQQLLQSRHDAAMMQALQHQVDVHSIVHQERRQQQQQDAAAVIQAVMQQQQQHNTDGGMMQAMLQQRQQQQESLMMQAAVLMHSQQQQQHHQQQQELAMQTLHGLIARGLMPPLPPDSQLFRHPSNFPHPPPLGPYSQFAPSYGAPNMLYNGGGGGPPPPFPTFPMCPTAHLAPPPLQPPAEVMQALVMQQLRMGMLQPPPPAQALLQLHGGFGGAQDPEFMGQVQQLMAAAAAASNKGAWGPASSAGQAGRSCSSFQQDDGDMAGHPAMRDGTAATATAADLQQLLAARWLVEGGSLQQQVRDRTASTCGASSRRETDEQYGGFGHALELCRGERLYHQERRDDLYRQDERESERFELPRGLPKHKRLREGVVHV